MHAPFDFRLPYAPTPYLKIVKKKIAGNEEETRDSKTAKTFLEENATDSERAGGFFNQGDAMMQHHDSYGHRKTEPVNHLRLQFSPISLHACWW